MTGLLNSSSYYILIVRIGKSSVIKGPAGTISSKSLSFEPRFKATSELVSLLKCHLMPPKAQPANVNVFHSAAVQVKNFSNRRSPNRRPSNVDTES